MAAGLAFLHQRVAAFVTWGNHRDTPAHAGRFGGVGTGRPELALGRCISNLGLHHIGRIIPLQNLGFLGWRHRTKFP